MTLTSSTTGIRNRKIATRYEIGEVMDGRDVGTRYVEIATSHARERRALITRVTYIDVVQMDGTGYTVEKWGSDTPYAMLKAAPVARYSDKALTAQHVDIADRFEAGEFDGTVAARLMLAQVREAQSIEDEEQAYAEGRLDRALSP